MRPKHWVKNILVFAALVFSKRLFETDTLVTVMIGFAALCLTSSIIYIFNDICDVEKDRNHEVKKHRPIASGAVPVKGAWILLLVLLALVAVLNIYIYQSALQLAIILVYLVTNVLYSMNLKNKPIIDVFILMLGFVLRVFYGAIIINQPISYWLYFTIMALSFYLGLGKRRNELERLGEDAGEVRKVLKYYTSNFLDKNMYMFLSAALVFYALWTADRNVVASLGTDLLILTVPLVAAILMKYSLVVEQSNFADPVDVVTGDKILIGLIISYGIIMVVAIYAGPVFGQIFV